MKRIIVVMMSVWFCLSALADKLIIPMDASQKNHLKAYGVAFWVLEKEQEVEWLLNYKAEVL